MYRIQLIIGPVWIVVEKYKMFDLSRQSQLTCLAYQTVSPASFLRHIFFNILGIVGQKVSIPRKMDKSLI